MSTIIHKILKIAAASLIIIVSSCLNAQSAAKDSSHGIPAECEPIVNEFVASTGDPDWARRMFFDEKWKLKPEEHYMKFLRRLGFKQAAGEVEVVWNGGVVNIQASNVKFSNSYKLIRSEQTGLENVFPHDAHIIERYFRYILAEQAEKTLPAMIQSYLSDYGTHGPVLLWFSDYPVYDSGCIPTRQAINVEHIVTFQEIDSMEITPWPPKPQ